MACRLADARTPLCPPGTIAQNISFFDIAEDRHEVMRAANLARIADEVSTRPRGSTRLSAIAAAPFQGAKGKEFCWPEPFTDARQC